MSVTGALRLRVLNQYWRQSGSSSVPVSDRLVADRIQGRAVRRLGDLLKLYDRGGDQSEKEGAHPFAPSRTAAVGENLSTIVDKLPGAASASRMVRAS